VIERRAGRGQNPDHFGVPQVRGGDERGAVIAAGDVLRARAELERELERRNVVRDGRDRDDVVAVGLERVRIGTRGDAAPASPRAGAEGRNVQRRAPTTVAQVDVSRLDQRDPRRERPPGAGRCSAAARSRWEESARARFRRAPRKSPGIPEAGASGRHRLSSSRRAAASKVCSSLATDRHALGLWQAHKVMQRASARRPGRMLHEKQRHEVAPGAARRQRLPPGIFSRPCRPPRQSS
jgi:hypothetical protein